jgi:hypothetical protein
MKTQQQQIAESLHSAHAIIALIIDHLSAYEDLPAHRVATSHRALVVASQAIDAIWEVILAAEEAA